MIKRIIALLLIIVVLTCGICSCSDNEEKKSNGYNSLSGASAVTEINDPAPDEAMIEIKRADDVKINFVNHNDISVWGLDESINELIKSYFTTYFKSLGSFEDLNVDSLFCPDAQYQSNIVNAMISYQNGIRIGMDIDMTYDEATVGVKYLSAAPVSGGYDVYLVHNDYMNYNFIPEITSYTSDVEHHFVVKEVEGQYLISEHSEISGVYSLIKKGFDQYTEGMNNYDTAEIFGIVKDWYVSTTDRELSKVLEQRSEYNSSPESFATIVTADNPYNIDSALAYSYEWAGKTEAKRNLDRFGMYDNYGGNCNNFTSQCLFAGGIPMDLSGVQWKWYGEAVNEFGGEYGRSPSWAECDYFYNYCVTNEGFGLVTDTDTNLYSGRPGDLIQYMVDETDAVHTVIITKVIYDDDGNVVEYLINSNTTDKVDCPMSAYGYTDFRLIKVIGWNN